MGVLTTAEVTPATLELLGDLAHREPNFDRDDGPFDAEHGWKVDDRCGPLPDERPGPPEPDGPFETACAVLRSYAMADPGIVRAAYDPDVPLLGREMALEGRFAWLRFPMAVRVTNVVDDTIRIDGHQVRRWGWSYSTLEGHLERGRMDWEVWKWVDVGDVDFRIHAFSQRGEISNPIVRLGFALFGHWTQERFYAAVLRRMALLVGQRTGRHATRAVCRTDLPAAVLGRHMGPGHAPPEAQGA